METAWGKHAMPSGHVCTTAKTTAPRADAGNRYAREGMMGRSGLEPAGFSPPKTLIPQKSRAESGVSKDEVPPLEPDPARIIKVWPRLSSAVLAIVRDAGAH